MEYHSIKQAKQQAASLRPGQFRHVLRVAAVTGRMRERDVMLLWVTHSTGIRVTELALLEIRDIMHPSGQQWQAIAGNEASGALMWMPMGNPDK